MILPEPPLDPKRQRTKPRLPRDRKDCSLVAYVRANPNVTLTRDMMSSLGRGRCRRPACEVCEGFRLRAAASRVIACCADWLLPSVMHTIHLNECYADEFDDSILEARVNDMHSLVDAVMALAGVVGAFASFEMAEGPNRSRRETLLPHVNLLVIGTKAALDGPVLKLARDAADVLRPFTHPVLNPDASLIYYALKGCLGRTRRQRDKSACHGTGWNPRVWARVAKIVNEHHTRRGSALLQRFEGVFEGHVRQSAERAVTLFRHLVLNKAESLRHMLSDRETYFRDAEALRQAEDVERNSGPARALRFLWLAKYAAPPLLVRLRRKGRLTRPVNRENVRKRQQARLNALPKKVTRSGSLQLPTRLTGCHPSPCKAGRSLIAVGHRKGRTQRRAGSAIDKRESSSSCSTGFSDDGEYRNLDGPSPKTARARASAYSKRHVHSTREVDRLSTAPHATTHRPAVS